MTDNEKVDPIGGLNKKPIEDGVSNVSGSQRSPKTRSCDRYYQCINVYIAGSWYHQRFSWYYGKKISCWLTDKEMKKKDVLNTGSLK